MIITVGNTYEIACSAELQSASCRSTSVSTYASACAQVGVAQSASSTCTDMPCLASLVVLIALLLFAPTHSRNVSYDARSFLVDGERALVLSGSIHYQRVHPTDWPRVLALAVEAGFNTIQTYVFWSLHEPERGSVSFSGANNLTDFIAQVGMWGLKAVVRLGPYDCGEFDNGGVPHWMRNTGASCFRCSDPVWLNYTSHVVTTVVASLKAAQLLWPQGGPVIMFQVENEYNGGDLSYLRSCVDIALNTTADIPWILCHDLDLCTKVNAQSTSPLGDAVCTINGFWEDTSSEGVQQPSPAFVTGQRKGNPLQPISWTEDQGWFDQFGLGQRVRRTSDILYGFARATAYGLTHHNFYMLTGGSNWGYIAAEGVTTAYAPDTAIDYLLLRHEPKFSTIRGFHIALTSVADDLLNSFPTAPVRVGNHCEISTYGNVAFVSNLGLLENATETVEVQGVRVDMPNHTVAILRNGVVLFNTSAAADFSPIAGATVHPTLPVRAAAAPVWETIYEHVGYGAANATAAQGSPPLEMLALTHGKVDYMYYTLTPAAPIANVSLLTVGTCGGEYVYVFADGVALMPVLRAADATSQRRTMHDYSFVPGSTVQRLDILISAMGLSTSPTPKSCKGIKRVVVDGTNDTLTNAGWTSRWMFAGEVARYYTATGAATAPWAPVASSGGTVPTSWFKAILDLPPAVTANAIQEDGDTVAPPQQAYALDLWGATKGVAWVNGFNIGRYNLELGVCGAANVNGSCAPPIHGGQCYIWFRNCGLPTQRYYHVPTALLNATGNLLVLFEETATVPVANEGPLAPSPPPVSAAVARERIVGSSSSTSQAMTHRSESTPMLRNLSRIALVSITDHP